MFERYTERARRVIFFARYEASQLGSASIETEHLLLGLIREGKGLTSRLFGKSQLSMEQIRKEIEEALTLPGEGLDLGRHPALGGEQAGPRLRRRGGRADAPQLHRHRAHPARADARGAQRRRRASSGEKGMRLPAVREDIVAIVSEKAAAGKAKETPLLSEFSRDLTEAAAAGRLDPLVGRDEELERVIQVLCRRTRNNPVLIGEPGVGKTALVEGLANKIVQGDVPVYLGGQADPGPRHLADRGRDQVPRTVRGAPEDDHAGAHRDPGHHHLHRRAAHPGGGGLGRGQARRRQHPQARPVPGRDPVHRGHHPRRVPQAHREGPRPRAPVPGGQGRVAHRGGDGRDRPRGQGALREVPQRALPRRGDRGRGRTSRAATSPTASCRTRRSTSSTRPAAG